MTVRLLLNENFPDPSAAILRRRGVDLISIGDVRKGLPDVEVLDLAVREGRWVITFDRDYGELIYGRKRPAPPAIVLLRVNRYQPAEPAAWIERMLETPERFERHFVVFEPAGFRLRPLIMSV